MPTRREGYLLSERGDFFIPSDFSSPEAKKNIDMIWPPAGETNHQRELN